MDSAQPIIVKKVKKGIHGHHGGAWKVAFADFVTAMMAFFMLMWLMGSTTPEQRSAISNYFENPSAIQGPGGASTSMIKLGAVDKDLNKSSKGENAQAEQTPPPTKVERVEVERDKQRLDNLKHELEQAIDASQALKPFKDQLLLDLTPEGLRIQSIDKEGRPMFDSGSATLKSYTKVILHEIAKLINTVPNRISLTGHTDATPYSSERDYSNWELSADRANASRRALVAGGLDEAKIAKVVGLASTVPFIKSDPRSPMNRRISLIVLNKAADAALRNNDATQVNSVQGAEQAITGSSRSSQTRPLQLQQPQLRVLNPTAGGGVSQRPKSVKPTPLGGASTTTGTRNSQSSAVTDSPPAKIQPVRPIQPINPFQLPTVAVPKAPQQ